MWFWYCFNILHTFLKTLHTFLWVFVNCVFNFCKFKRFWPRNFLEIYEVEVFISACNLDRSYWIALKLHHNIVHHICYSIPTIFCWIFYFLFSHFFGVDFEFLSTIFRLAFLKVLTWKCVIWWNDMINLNSCWLVPETPELKFHPKNGASLC